jgi:hypothetical protein
MTYIEFINLVSVVRKMNLNFTPEEPKYYNKEYI